MTTSANATMNEERSNNGRYEERTRMIAPEFNPLEFRSIRLDANRTLVEIAGVIGTSPSNLSRWERGVEIPKADSFIRWCAAIEEVLTDVPIRMDI
jgi:DNA-binding transcriptional regulator YiaG